MCFEARLGKSFDKNSELNCDKGMIFVTGGAGFIGSNFILNWFKNNDEEIVNLDKLTYAGNLQNLESISNNKNYFFTKTDICDLQQVQMLFSKFKPRAVVHFAAESHVDRSIHGPAAFIETNIVGTFNLLEGAKKYWSDLDESEKKQFRFLHVSTDEVYGSLDKNDPAFTELTPFAPNSPYSASKASSDHLVRAYFHTYAFPVITTNCSNNYGPYQFPEKLIPLMIYNALQLKPLPIYGDGLNIRDWLYVTDHCEAIESVLKNGRLGETYNIGGWNEKTNIDVVTTICKTLNHIKPRQDGRLYQDQITYITDRKGHDRRYAIDARKIEKELGWKPRESFETGIQKTIKWYLDHNSWIENVVNGDYKNWVARNYNKNI